MKRALSAALAPTDDRRRPTSDAMLHGDPRLLAEQRVRRRRTWRRFAPCLLATPLLCTQALIVVYWLRKSRPSESPAELPRQLGAPLDAPPPIPPQELLDSLDEPTPPPDLPPSPPPSTPPPPEPHETLATSSAAAAARLSATAAAAPYAASTRCISRGRGYWTFEVCLGVNVSQFHAVVAGVDRHSVSLIGRHDAALDSDGVQRYVGGDACGEPPRPREASVKLVCGRTRERILAIDEPEKCVYQLSVEVLTCEQQAAQYQ